MDTELFSALSLLAALLALGMSIILWDGYRRNRRRANLGYNIFSEATIAHDLVPKLERLVKNKSALYVTGGDAYPLTTKDDAYPWRAFLKRVLKAGSVVHYVVTDAAPDDKNVLLKLKTELEGGTGGKLEYYFATPEDVEPPDRELVARLRTFHPTLIEWDNNRAMWIEDYHPPNSTVAYSCEFVPPERAQTDPRYDRYKRTLLHLMGKYSATA